MTKRRLPECVLSIILRQSAIINYKSNQAAQYRKPFHIIYRAGWAKKWVPGCKIVSWQVEAEMVSNSKQNAPYLGFAFYPSPVRWRLHTLHPTLYE